MSERQMVWNPFSEKGLWSNYDEVHLTLRGLTLAVLTIILDVWGYRTIALITIFVVIVTPSFPYVERSNPWYVDVPYAVVVGLYVLLTIQ